MKKVFRIYMSVFLLGVMLTACGGGGGESSSPPPPGPIAATSWTIQYGTGADDIAVGIAVDSSGYIYAAGNTCGSLDGNNNNVGCSDLFVVKYDDKGNKLWTRQLGTTFEDLAYDIAVDNSGYIYVTGSTIGTLPEATDGTLTSPYNNPNSGITSDLFVVKLNPADGTTVWTRQLGTASDDLAYDIVVDNSSNIYVTGTTEGDLDENISAGGTDVFVVKYDTNGTKLWTRQLGTPSDDGSQGIAVDNSGNFYVTGITSYAANFDFFVVKYVDSGTTATKKWTQNLGTLVTDKVRGIAVDGSNIYVTGYTNGSLGGASSHEGGDDLFVVKLTEENGSPKVVWTTQLGTVVDDWANGIALDSNGNIYVTGFTFGNLGVTGNQGGADLFVVKFNPADGTQIWTKQLGTGVDDWANGIALDSSGNIYVTGYTDGDLDGNSNIGLNDFFVVKLIPNG